MWLVVAVVLSATLASCSDDDTTEDEGKLTYVASVQVSEDLLDLATLYVWEYGSEGLGPAIVLTEDKQEWRKPISTYPEKVGMAFSLEPKNGEQTKEKYDLTLTCKASLVDAKGNVKGAAVKYTKVLIGVKAEYVPALLEQVQSDLLQQKTLFEITGAGNFTQYSLDDVK